MSAGFFGGEDFIGVGNAATRPLPALYVAFEALFGAAGEFNAVFYGQLLLLLMDRRRLVVVVRELNDMPKAHHLVRVHAISCSLTLPAAIEDARVVDLFDVLPEDEAKRKYSFCTIENYYQVTVPLSPVSGKKLEGVN